MNYELNKNQKTKDIVYIIKSLLRYIVLLSVGCEMIFFPSWGNLAGCIMMIISYLVFVNLFLKRGIIINFPFGFMMFLSMFMYRFLPVPATLLEGIPVSYGMNIPIKTFLFETILFLVSSCAFYFAVLNSNRNNLIQIIFKNIGLFKTTNRNTLWIIGIFASIIRVITFSMGSIAIGNVLGKFLLIFVNFMYIPMLLFFPGFYMGEYSKKPNFKQPLVWIYLIVISILNLAANSRESLIEPLATIALLYMMYLCINNISVKQIINPKRVIPILLTLFISLKLLNIASDAILSIRNIRHEKSFTELIELTFNIIVDSDSDILKEKRNNNYFNIPSYEEGWTEEYLSNFILNRYANMRITDETLYLEQLIKSNNSRIMLEDFVARIVLILPQPVIDILSLNINKNDYRFSRGDALYVFSGIGNSYNLGGYRVTSHIGDGLATFGVLYFPMQFIVFFVIFKLLNCYLYIDKKNKRIYSIYGLFSLYTCLNIFRNANGMIGEINFGIRGYWQEILIFILVFSFARFISNIRLK